MSGPQLKALIWCWNSMVLRAGTGVAPALPNGNRKSRNGVRVEFHRFDASGTQSSDDPRNKAAPSCNRMMKFDSDPISLW
jgi:hypothetical protein